MYLDYYLFRFLLDFLSLDFLYDKEFFELILKLII